VAQTLDEILLDPARRPAVVTDLQELVDQEVSEKSGVSGAVVKTGYATVKKLKPGVITTAVDRLLGEFVTALGPYYGEYRAAGTGADFGAYLSTRPDAAEALLGVTDARAENSSSEGLKKVYAKVRPHGRRNVEEALPRLGRVIDKHAAQAGQ
jgi:hypothetical protein